MTAHLRLILRALGLVTLTGALLPVYLAVPRRGVRRRVVRTWNRCACAIAGFQVKVHGAPLAGTGHLFAANHVTYLDIVALASQLDVRFVAKREVADWPVIGYLARIIGTIFVERSSRRADMQIDSLRNALTAGHSVAVFPEGTSTEGLDVLPFKSSLFQAAVARSREAALWVQPVTVAYHRDHAGMPLNAEDRAVYPWVGDATLVPHLAEVLKRPGVEITLAFAPPVEAGAFSGRKALADHCRRVSADELARLTARARAPLPAPPRRLTFGGDDAGGLEDVPYFASFD
jgi:1-acyl-sn-glycerol-3-phosphate acyltransferase